MKRLLAPYVLASLWLLASHAWAEIEDTSKTFGPHTVHYSVFNSAFVPAEIARLHGLTRAKDQVLLNISVQDTASGASVPAVVKGEAKNLIQQLTALEFKTITEADASYAIASLRHTNEEIFHFKVFVTPEGATKPYELTFTRKLYREQ